MKTKTNKILSIILSLAMVFSCTLATFSINASAESDEEKIANLKNAWSQVTIAPDVLLEYWYDNNGTWQKNTNITATEINGNFWPVFDSDNIRGTGGLINKSNGNDGIGSTDNPVDIDDYERIFFYYTLEEKITDVQLATTNAEGSTAGVGINITLPAVTQWTEFDLKSALSAQNTKFDGTVSYFMRVHFKSVPNNLKMTSVLAVPTFEKEFGFDIDSDTSDWTLNDWLQEAIKFDFNKYSNGQAVVDLLNEYYYNTNTNFVDGIYIEAYRTDASGTPEAITESELSIPTRKLLHDNLLENAVQISRNNSTVDIIFCLPNIKKVSQLGVFTKSQNIKKLNIYTSNIKEAVWNRSNLAFTYSESADNLSNEISFTFEEFTNVKYIRFSITDAVNSVLDLTEIYARGPLSEDKGYENILLNSNNNFYELSAALKNIESGTVTDAKTDDNRYGSNQNTLKIDNITDGVDDTVYDFMIGYANDTSFNLIIDLKQAYTIDRIALKSGSDKNYYPTKMNFYLGSTKESVTKDNPTPVKTYNAKTEDGIYEAEFSPVVGQYICIEIIDNDCTYYTFYEDGAEVGNQYLLTVVDEISVYGSKFNTISINEGYDQYISEIREAWGNVRHKPEVLLDTFWTKNSTDNWSSCVTDYGVSTDIYIDGVKETVNTHKFEGIGPYIIHIPEETDASGNLKHSGFQNSDTNIILTDYEEIYYYAKYNYSNTVTVQEVDTGSHPINDYINVSKGWKKYNIDINKLLAVNDTTGKLGRLQMDTATGLSVSTVMGVKKMDYASEFGTDVSDNLSNNNWSIAQWIVAAAGIDFSQYNGGEYVIDAINKVKSDMPEYGALYDLAAVWKTTNKITGTYSLDTVKGVDKTLCSSGNIHDDYNFVADATINKYTFTGRGANNTYLLKDGYSASATYSGNFNNDAVVYLSYYVPEEVTRDPYIFTTFEGIGATAAQTGNKVFLTERGKWSLLTSDNLKGPSYGNITSVSKIECDMDSNSGIGATLYLGPVIFAEDSTINNVTGNTIEDYLAKANELNLEDGVYTNEAVFEAARTALNKAIADVLNSKNCKIIGDASLVWDDGTERKSYYTENYINYTAFRVFAQYTCPNVNGKADPSRIIVNGNTYNLYSRGILINRNSTAELTVGNYNDLGAKYQPIYGDDLTNRYWEIIDNGDGTSNVVFSIKLIKVNRNNAETKTHTTRAVIQYYGENGILKTIYSKQVQHGTIHDIWQAVGTGSWFPEIDFDNKDNWDVRPFD